MPRPINAISKKRTGHFSWVKAFLSELSRHGAVCVAAESAGVNNTTVHRYRKKSPTFAKAWQDALDRAADRMEAEIVRRGFEGCERPIFQQGVEVGRVREYSDTLAMFWLKGQRPQKYRDNQQTNIQVNSTVNVTISEAERQKLLERRRVALTAGSAN